MSRLRFIWSFLIVFSLSLVAASDERDPDIHSVLADLKLSPLQISQILKTAKVTDGRRARDTIYWLRSHHVIEVGKVLLGFPMILRMSVPAARDENLELKQPVRKNLKANEGTLEEKVQWFLAHGVSDIPGLLAESPQVLGNSIQSYENHWRWLLDKGVSNPEKVIPICPAILGENIERSLEPKFKILANLEVPDLPKFIEDYPEYFTHSLKKIGSTIRWLAYRRIVPVGLVIQKWPKLFDPRPSSNLEPKYRWLESLGVKDVPAVFRSFPQISGVSLRGNLKPKVKWFERVGIKDVGGFIDRFPPIFSYDLAENLKPTYALLKRAFGMTPEEIESYPRMLAASLGRLQELEAWANRSDLNLAVGSFSKRRKLVQSASLAEALNNLRELLKSSDQVIPPELEQEKLLGKIARHLAEQDRAGVILKKYSASNRMGFRARKWCLDALDAIK